MDIAFVDQYNMLPEGCRVLCAVSGGADSVYLLYKLLELSRERGIFVCAAHFDHCLRGAESKRDAAFVESLCKGLGVPFRLGSADVGSYAREHALGIEEAARVLRYAFLEEAAAALEADRIATAHNLNDNAETVLLNLTRGTGAKGLCGIPPVRGRIVRPILTVSRARIEADLASRGAEYVEDSTNAQDTYARNRIRHGVVPVLQDINGGFLENVLRSARLLRQDEDFLEALAQDFLAQHFQDGELPAEKLCGLPRPVAVRAVRMAAGRALTERHVDAVLALAEGAGRGCADVPGMRITREQGKLRFGGEDARPMEPVILLPGSSVYLADANLTIRSQYIPECSEIHISLNTFFFNCENICGTITCTSPKNGDKLRLAERKCTKKLSDLFSEKHMTRKQRLLTPVLRDEAGILAVYGFGTAERCAGKPGDCILRIDINVGESI